MTPMTSDAAQDAIYSRLLEKWNDGKAAAGAPNAKLFFAANLNAVAAPTDMWARVTRSVVVREPRKVGLSNGKVQHTEVGNVIIQLFTPLNRPECWQIGENLANLLRNAMVYPAASGGVWFRRAIARPQPDDRAWRFWLIQAEYEFDETI